MSAIDRQGEGGRVFLALLFLMAVVAAFFWPLVTMKAISIQDDIAASDLNDYHLPARAYLGEALRAGRFPIWCERVFCGFPFAASIEFGIFYPFTLLLYGLLPLVPAHNLSTLLPFLVTALGMILLGRRLGLDWGGTLIASLSYCFCGPFIMHMRLPNMVNSACWLPLLFTCLEAFLQTERRAWAAALAGVFALQVLAAHPQITYYTLLALVTYMLLRRLMGREGGLRAFPRRVLLWSGTRWLGLFLLVALAMGAVQIFPTWELKEMTRRGGPGVSLAFAQAHAYPLADALTFVLPYANGDSGAGSYGGTIHWENYGYVGLLPFLLAGFALLRRFGETLVRRLVWLGVLAYLMVLGPQTPFFGLCFRLLPGMGMFRFPQRFLFVVDLVLALLAGIAWTRLCRRWRDRGAGGRKLAIAATAIVLVVTVGDLAWVQLRQVPMYAARDWLAPPKTALRILADEGHGRIYTVGSIESHREAYREARGWQGDLRPYFEQREFLQANSALLYGLDTTDAYMNLTPRHVAAVFGELGHEKGLVRDRIYGGGQRVEDWSRDPVIARTLGMWNTSHILSLWPQEHEDLERLEGTGRVRLYRNRRCLPRARVVPHRRFLPDLKAVVAAMAAADFDPRNEVLLLTKEGQESGEGSSSTPGLLPSSERPKRETFARIVEDGVETLRLEVEAGAGGYLVLADTWYPGWTVTVDGVERPLLRANGCARAVALAGGRHVVVFAFRSDFLRRGLLTSGLALLIWGLLSLWAMGQPLSGDDRRAKMGEVCGGGSNECPFDEHASPRRVE